jgi:hypothetical protein
MHPLCGRAPQHARRRGASAIGGGKAHTVVILPTDRSSVIGFRFFTLRLLLQRRWSGLLLHTVVPASEVGGVDLEECQRVVDEHMREERRRKEGKDVVADWDSGFSDG